MAMTSPTPERKAHAPRWRSLSAGLTAIALLLNLDTYDSHPVLHNTQKTLLEPDTITKIAMGFRPAFSDRTPAQSRYEGESPRAANTQKILLEPDTRPTKIAMASPTPSAIALQAQFIYVGELPCAAKHSKNFA